MSMSIVAVLAWVALRANVHAKPSRKSKTCAVPVPNPPTVADLTTFVCVCKKAIAAVKTAHKAVVAPMDIAVPMSVPAFKCVYQKQESVRLLPVPTTQTVDPAKVAKMVPVNPNPYLLIPHLVNLVPATPTVAPMADVSNFLITSHVVRNLASQITSVPPAIFVRPHQAVDTAFPTN